MARHEPFSGTETLLARADRYRVGGRGTLRPVVLAVAASIESGENRITQRRIMHAAQELSNRISDISERDCWSGLRASAR